MADYFRLAVIRQEPMPSAEITSYKPTKVDHDWCGFPVVRMLVSEI
jgi:hypothetical protein